MSATPESESAIERLLADLALDASMAAGFGRKVAAARAEHLALRERVGDLERALSDARLIAQAAINGSYDKSMKAEAGRSPVFCWVDGLPNYPDVDEHGLPILDAASRAALSEAEREKHG